MHPSFETSCRAGQWSFYSPYKNSTQVLSTYIATNPKLTQLIAQYASGGLEKQPNQSNAGHGDGGARSDSVCR